MKPTLVTGGAGFVGRHLVKKLVEEKKESVFIIDNLSTGKHPDLWINNWQKEKRGELLIYSKDNITITFFEIDALQFFTQLVGDPKAFTTPDFKDVYHLASIVGGRALIDGDPLLVSYDLAIDASLFLWATRQPKKFERILYASSSAAYPIHLQSENNALALKEEFIDFATNNLGRPDMTYGWSKVSGEYLARLAHEHYGLHVACVRPFSGYGEDQDLTYPVPAIGLRVAKHENPIEVWGTGEQGRDFIYIDDCIDAMFMILDKVRDGRGINIGTGRLTSFNQLIGTFLELENYVADTKRLLDKPVGVQSRYADVTILNKEIGYQVTTPLKAGLKKVLAYAHKRAGGEAKL
jgi:UDP-glucose 4-epimerase